jgi:DNA-binding transcriptional regulator YiaG
MIRKRMSAAEFRKALEQSQLSKVQFAFAIGADGRTVRRWADGSRRIPPIASGVLRLMLAEDIGFRQMRQAVTGRPEREYGPFTY